MSYHGSDLTIVWQRPGGTLSYPGVPMGYSLYVDGRLAFTADDLAHLTWDSRTGLVAVLDGSATHVRGGDGAHVPAADEADLSGNPRVTDSFQRAGLDLSRRHASAPDLAAGKTATASFTTASPAPLATSPANAVDGFTISGLPVVSGPYIGTNPIWGDLGSPNAQDWLQIDLGSPAWFNDAKLYFYSNKMFGAGGNTYREPAAYTIQYFDGTSWVDVPRQAQNPPARLRRRHQGVPALQPPRPALSGKRSSLSSDPAAHLRQRDET